MVVVFRVVLTMFCSWFPFARAPHTDLSPVVSMMRLVVHFLLRCSKPEKLSRGAHIQFDSNVKIIGFGFFAIFFNSLSCRFRRAGYIIRKRQTLIGIEIPANCRLLIAKLRSGINCERVSPVSIHSKTHNARYFSNILS
jgi:hypothetical protein